MAAKNRISFPGTVLEIYNNTTIISISANELLTAYKRNILTVPDFQRDIQEDNVKLIRACIIKDNTWLYSQGNLTVGYLEMDNNQCTYFLVDGQHRLFALEYMHELGVTLENIRVIIACVKCKTENDIENLFSDKNKNSPVDYHYTYFEDTTIRSYIFQIKQFLLNNYKDAFKVKRDGAKSNHLHIDEFMQLFDVESIKEYIKNQPEDAKLVESLIYEIDAANQAAHDQLVTYGTSRQFYMKDPDYNRALKTNFYLPYKQVICKNCIFGRGEIIIELIEKHKKTKIPRSVAQELWSRHFGNSISGHCYCCTCKITNTTFVCGHVRAEAKGGLTHITNLKPVCNDCNSRMGTDDMEEYRARIVSMMDHAMQMAIVNAIEESLKNDPILNGQRNITTI
jgi:hypothetical protein